MEITCSETHWFFDTKETSKSFTCQDNEEWIISPVCEGKMIEKHFWIGGEFIECY